LFPNKRNDGLRISIDLLGKEIDENSRRMVFNNMKWYVTPLIKNEVVLMELTDSKNK
jgi:hypothetical protein